MNRLRHKTVKLLGSLMRPLVNEDVILVSEEKTILQNLRHLAQKDCLAPVVTPRLIDRNAAAEMLSISVANFKRIEKDGGFSFSKKIVGNGAVRYRNVDVIDYILSEQSSDAN